MATARNGGVLTQSAFAGSAWLHGKPLKGGGWGLPFLPNQPLARAGGVLTWSLFVGSTKLPSPVGAARNGGKLTRPLFAGSGKLATPVGAMRAGGVLAWGAFAGSAKPAQVTSVSRAGGVLTLSLFRGSTLFQEGPAVANQSPAPGSTISPGATVSFDVVDVRAFLFLEVQVDQAQREVIHDGDSFLIPYLGSIRFAIPGGWRYQVRRTGGWVVGPTFRVRVYDVAEVGG